MEEEKDVYNLPIAAFTFGKNGKISPYYPIQDLKDLSKENLAKSKQPKNNHSIESKGSKDSNTYSNEDSEKRFSFKNIINKNANNLKNSSNNLNNNNNLNINIKNNNFNNNNFVFIDKGDSNSSYLNTILYSISYMKLLNNYLINEFKINENEQNININLSPKEKFLSIIKNILVKIEQIRNSDKSVNNSININNIINIETLKDNLSNLFKNKKKFLKSSPDEPLDFLYVIINFLHSLKIKKDNGEVNNVCASDCFSHNYLWVKMLKHYECECKGQSKKILNKNNYFIDIPINIIINKYYKNNMYDINQKLFIYYKQIISNITINIDCPKLGNECKINKVHYKYILKNFPSYLIFNLENDFFKNNELFYSLKDILKNFVLIPHIFNINSLFDIENNNNDNKNYYELIGIIFLKVSKVYTCMFKQNNIFNYYDDNTFLNFNNYYDIILYSIKNGLIPVSIFYQNIDLNTDNNIDRNSIKYDPNYELNKEQIAKLEKYIKNTNSLTKNLKNKIRTSENIISDNYTINYSIGSTNNNNPSFSDYYNNSSRYSGSINSFSSYQKNEYLCNHCERINKIENKICFFCGYDNRPYLTNLNKNINLIKQKSNNISHKNSIKKKITLTSSNNTNQQKQNNELGEIEEEYKSIDPHVLKYFDMPRPYIPTHQNNEKITSSKQSPKSNKNKIPYSSNNNKSNNIKNNERVHLNNPTNILNSSESNTLDNNILSKMDTNFNFKRNSKIIHNKRNSNNDDLRGKNYYSELRNNQLNINLKINNNNNYNIFDFSNKKNIVNMEGLEGNGTNFTEKKILKKINLIKNKKLKKFSINNSNSSGNIESNSLKFKFINNNINSNSKNDLNKVNFGIYFQSNNNEK